MGTAVPVKCGDQGIQGQDHAGANDLSFHLEMPGVQVEVFFLCKLGTSWNLGIHVCIFLLLHGDHF